MRVGMSHSRPNVLGPVERRQPVREAIDCMELDSKYSVPSKTLRLSYRCMIHVYTECQARSPYASCQVYEN